MKSKGLLRVFSNTTVQKHQFFGAQLSSQSNSLRPHKWQHTRLPCLSPTPRACSNSLSIQLLMPSNHLILCSPLLLSSVFPSIRVFSHVSVLHTRWPKYWSCSFSISPSNEGRMYKPHHRATGTYLHRTGETDSGRAQTEPCAHQDPGERSSDPTRG